MSITARRYCEPKHGITIQEDGDMDVQILDIAQCFWCRNYIDGECTMPPTYHCGNRKEKNDD